MNLEYSRIGEYLLPNITLKEPANVLPLGKYGELLKLELEAFAADNEKTDKFIALVRKYTSFEELTTPMLNEFVQKIYVHAPDKSSGRRVQEVDVHLNYIGQFDVPTAVEPTAEEIQAEELRQQKLIKQREYNKRCYEKRKAKKAAAQAEAEIETENADEPAVA